MARIYRQMPLNSIWEGSGNVMCLDVLRAIRKHPGCLDVLAAEVAPALGRDRRLDAFAGRLMDDLHRAQYTEESSRQLTQAIATMVQAAMLVRFAPDFVADAYCATRLGASGFTGGAFGNLPGASAFEAIIERALPE